MDISNEHIDGGIGASLPPEQIAAWKREHMEMLKKYAPESFTVKHFAAIAVMEKI
ncbi:methyltransferase domain [Ruminococcus sp. CAG:579]|nr:methyltransferase domain [Ruminococcus sp. CAG:579]